MKRQHFSTKPFVWFGISLLVGIFFWGGKVPAAEKKVRDVPHLVWPAPPDEPRIAYLKSISGPSDIGSFPSRWQKVAGFFTGQTVPRDGLIKPLGIATDDVGNLYISDTANKAVYFCDVAHKKWNRWDRIGKAQFASPVAVVRGDKFFYAADSELGKVIVFNEKGREQFVIGPPLQRPVGLAINGDTLFVVDSQQHEVYAFDLRGRSQFEFGKRGTCAGEFNFPTHISADKHGHLLVTDSLNSRVQVFDVQGKFISVIGSAGDAPGHFGRPKGVAADSFGHIYVVDAVFDNIQVFDLSGRLLMSWGESGVKPGQFGVPAGIAIGADNRIYVADSYNHRVQIFQYIGAP